MKPLKIKTQVAMNSIEFHSHRDHGPTGINVIFGGSISDTRELTVDQVRELHAWLGEVLTQGEPETECTEQEGGHMKDLNIESTDPGCHLLARDKIRPGFAEIRFTAPSGFEGRFPRRYLDRDGALKLRDWLSDYLAQGEPEVEGTEQGHEDPKQPTRVEFAYPYKLGSFVPKHGRLRVHAGSPGYVHINDDDGDCCRIFTKEQALNLVAAIQHHLGPPQETPSGGSESPVEPISDAPKGEVPGEASEAAHGAPAASGVADREWTMSRDRMARIANEPQGEYEADACDIWESCSAVCERLEAILEEVSGQRRRSEEWQRLASASAYQEILKLIPEDRARWLKKLLGEES